MNTRIKNLLGISALITFALSGSHPAFAQRVRGNFEESEIKEVFRKKRDAVFTPWGSKAQVEVQLRNFAADGKVLLMVERNSNGELRAFFDFAESKGIQVSYATAITESQLLATHEKREKSGHKLLFLSKNPTGDEYCATWIENQGYKNAVGKLLALGVTPAKIQIKHSKNTEPVTSEKRQWTDKTGRIIEAALADIDGDKIILVKKGGSRFAYSISDLSPEDQLFLKQTIADHQKPGREKSGNLENTAKNGAFTDWHSFYEWNELLKEEKNKDRYPVYVENNKDRKLRGIFDKQPEGMQWKIGWLDSEEALMKMDKNYQAEGMKILSLSFDRRNQLYYGMWVSESTLEQAKAQLKTAGVSPADIGRNIKVSRVSKK